MLHMLACNWVDLSWMDEYAEPHYRGCNTPPQHLLLRSRASKSYGRLIAIAIAIAIACLLVPGGTAAPNALRYIF